MRLRPTLFALTAPLFAYVATAPATARADEPAARMPDAPRTLPVRRAPVKKKPPEPKQPAAPAPSVTLAVEAPSPDVPWTVRVENTGAVPLRIVADAHLVTFEVTAPDAKKPIRCELPAEMRPHGDDEDRALVVPPGRAWAEKLDPRLFCFGKRAGAALVPGAKVTAHLGWRAPKRGRLAPPYEVSPIEGLEPAVAHAKEIVSPEATIGTPPPITAAPAASRTVAVTTPSYEDVERGATLTIPVTVRNVSTHAVTFLLRPETVTFEVTGPSGVGVTDPSPTVVCESDARPGTAVRDVFTTLAPRGATSMTMMAAPLCPDRTFDHAGLYVVHAKLDTRDASGADVGLRTFDAEVPADGATRVRVRRSATPPEPPPRPKLEEKPRAAAR